MRELQKGAALVGMIPSSRLAMRTVIFCVGKGCSVESRTISDADVDDLIGEHKAVYFVADFGRQT